MPNEITLIKQHIQNFTLGDLFVEELGWNRVRRVAPFSVVVGDEKFVVETLCEKSGFQVFVCKADEVPDANVRLKIERNLDSRSIERLVVFQSETEQLWEWMRREPNLPIKPYRESFRRGSSGERLAQKVKQLSFSIDEETQGILTTDVARRASSAFYAERITKSFYNHFKDAHKKFCEQIKGIANEEEQNWYASLMLNRLMFAYFIQFKGFLDGNQNYLTDKLAEMKRDFGTDKFYSFYRKFLLRLFHDGLGKQNHNAELVALIGKVPYLNGGLFEVHRIENQYAQIEISDAAFEDIFAFFDRYDWHLDDRPLGNEREINPDVLGYIFEKFINQKQMGAYYTKEDITEYISKNTILPFLFDRAAAQNSIPFDAQNGEVWRILDGAPDSYIYAAVRKGVIDEDGAVIDLPAEIAVGVDDVSGRGGWNRTADDKFGLPTETWREFVARRQRCLEIRDLISNGKIRGINDFITYNLDIRQFAQDILRKTDSPDLIQAFYKAIAGQIPLDSSGTFQRGISVLDPTCGSGAFLFAALNVLQPLYEACLDRMEAFVAEADANGKSQSHPDFRRVLAEVKRHANRNYFVLKSIIIGNLYGVDIMHEAVEICKLRLFLKLAAQVDADATKPNYGLEPLPDIDFNIRAGNTLVGFANLEEVRRATASKFNFDDALKVIEVRASEVDRAYKEFRAMQTHYEYNAVTLANAKTVLRERTEELNAELNDYLAGEYGINLTQSPARYTAWLKNHQPFHWYTEFYGIIHDGGFDVIIGNPPYIASSKIRRQYIIKNYQTANCTDVYASVLERCSNVLVQDGRSGMIVPLSVTFSGNFDILRHHLYEKYCANWFSSFARIPAALFSADVRVRNTIHIGHKGKTELQTLATVLHRWFEKARPHLFSNLNYVSFTPELHKNLIPKANTQKLLVALEQTISSNKILARFC